MNRYIISLLLSLFLLTVILPYAIGKSNEQLEQKRSELENIRAQIEEKRAILNQLRQQENSIIGQIDQIDANLDLKETELKDVNYRLNLLQQKIQDTNSQINYQRKIIQEKELQVANRLRSIYMMQELPFFDIVLSMNNNVNDWFETFFIFERIASQDKEVLNQYNVAMENLNMLLKTQEEEKTKALELKNDLDQKKQEIIAQRSERQVILKNIMSNRASYEAAEAELQAKSREIEAFLRNLGSGPRVGTGRFIWPASGPITSPFGPRFDPYLHVQSFHTGIDIGAEYGSPIVAADSGRVVYSGWYDGYGKAIIIDHGGGVSTLYAHASRLIAYVGENVRQGQVIGYVGDTGYATGPHLHFEIRINGKPVNPLLYLP
ncbi:peptidase M23 family [Thermodesulfobium acidiphilum]|uniref:Peptidase M23 family n=1 Tax=Thermodesulfobium acidiphilum TaxID=1794699 RepID=A0A2R4VYL4_THEAF|nr:peptidoglycan DD-metalloendopeptidase family protein [Thermodesulfobium acidiphilum]AWB09582.1 peptidase M23 family [Thermodesulfobium acidiphilum]